MSSAKKKVLKKPAVDEPQLKRWVEKGKSLVTAKSGNQWKIGDWILAGEETFGKKRAYDIAQEVTGMKRATLYLFKDTAECFPISTRVKNLFFGHHRLVADKEYTHARRMQLLRTALKRKMSVAKFDAYLKSREKSVEQQENTPTNADAAAKKVLEQCQYLRDHLSIRALLKSDPPKDYERRKQVVKELRATADQLNKNAESLTEMWRQFDLVHYHDLRAEAAGSGR